MTPKQTEDLRALLNQLQIEQKVKDGAENMLQVVFSTGGGHGHGHGGHDGQELLRKQVESELSAANAKISALTRHIERLQAKSGEPPLTPSEIYVEQVQMEIMDSDLGNPHLQEFHPTVLEGQAIS